MLKNPVPLLQSIEQLVRELSCQVHQFFYLTPIHFVHGSKWAG